MDFGFPANMSRKYTFFFDETPRDNRVEDCIVSIINRTRKAHIHPSVIATILLSPFEMQKVEHIFYGEIKILIVSVTLQF